MVSDAAGGASSASRGHSSAQPDLQTIASRLSAHCDDVEAWCGQLEGETNPLPQMLERAAADGDWGLVGALSRGWWDSCCLLQDAAKALGTGLILHRYDQFKLRTRSSPDIPEHIKGGPRTGESLDNLRHLRNRQRKRLRGGGAGTAAGAGGTIGDADFDVLAARVQELIHRARALLARAEPPGGALVKQRCPLRVVRKLGRMELSVKAGSGGALALTLHPPCGTDLKDCQCVGSGSGGGGGSGGGARVPRPRPDVHTWSSQPFVLDKRRATATFDGERVASLDDIARRAVPAAGDDDDSDGDVHMTDVGGGGGGARAAVAPVISVRDIQAECGHDPEERARAEADFAAEQRDARAAVARELNDACGGSDGGDCSSDDGSSGDSDGSGGGGDEVDAQAARLECAGDDDNLQQALRLYEGIAADMRTRATSATTAATTATGATEPPQQQPPRPGSEAALSVAVALRDVGRVHGLLGDFDGAHAALLESIALCGDTPRAGGAAAAQLERGALEAGNLWLAAADGAAGDDCAACLAQAQAYYEKSLALCAAAAAADAAAHASGGGGGREFTPTALLRAAFNLGQALAMRGGAAAAAAARPHLERALDEYARLKRAAAASASTAVVTSAAAAAAAADMRRLKRELRECGGTRARAALLLARAAIEAAKQQAVATAAAGGQLSRTASAAAAAAALEQELATAARRLREGLRTFERADDDREWLGAVETLAQLLAAHAALAAERERHTGAAARGSGGRTAAELWKEAMKLCSDTAKSAKSKWALLEHQARRTVHRLCELKRDCAVKQSDHARACTARGASGAPLVISAARLTAPAYGNPVHGAIHAAPPQAFYAASVIGARGGNARRLGVPHGQPAAAGGRGGRGGGGCHGRGRFAGGAHHQLDPSPLLPPPDDDANELPSVYGLTFGELRRHAGAPLPAGAGTSAVRQAHNAGGGDAAAAAAELLLRRGSLAALPRDYTAACTVTSAAAVAAGAAAATVNAELLRRLVDSLAAQEQQRTAASAGTKAPLALDLSGCGLTPFDANWLGTALLQRARDGDLSAGGGGGGGGRADGGSGAAVTLSLAGNYAATGGALAAAAARALPCLRALDLSRCGLTLAHLAALAPPAPPQLPAAAYAEANALGATARPPPLPLLEELCLADNRFLNGCYSSSSDGSGAVAYLQGASALGALVARCASLRRLDLSGSCKPALARATGGNGSGCDSEETFDTLAEALAAALADGLRARAEGEQQPAASAMAVEQQHGQLLAAAAPLTLVLERVRMRSRAWAGLLSGLRGVATPHTVALSGAQVLPPISGAVTTATAAAALRDLCADGPLLQLLALDGGSFAGAACALALPTAPWQLRRLELAGMDAVTAAGVAAAACASMPQLRVLALHSCALPVLGSSAFGAFATHIGTLCSRDRVPLAFLALRACALPAGAAAALLHAVAQHGSAGGCLHVLDMSGNALASAADVDNADTQALSAAVAALRTMAVAQVTAQRRAASGEELRLDLTRSGVGAHAARELGAAAGSTILRLAV